MNAAQLYGQALLALALGLALLGASLLLRARQRTREEQVVERALHRATAAPAADKPAPPASPWRRALGWIEALGHRFENGRLGDALLADEDRLLLDQTNHNTRTGRATFLGMRLALALLLPALVAAWLQPTGITAVIELGGALALGVLLPKFALKAWAERVRKRTEDELPLLIDLLRLLQGVGFSMDQSLQTIAERFQPVLPVLGAEIRDANTAYMHGRPRGPSLRRLANAFGNDDLQSLVQIIMQVHEHGGAVQEPLRQFAARLREQRKMTLREKTGQLAVKMTVVMMLTLLPALMLVLAGPAVISLVGTMGSLK